MIIRTVILTMLLTTFAASATHIEPPMVLIPQGEFVMGSEKGRPNEMPAHHVTVDAFYIGKYEVTVKEFREFVKDTGFKRTDSGNDLCWNWHKTEYIKPTKGNWDDKFNAPSEYHPVMCVTIEQAKAYVAWLAKKTDKPYRLLTEAEWEYAARAGSQGKHFFGEDDTQLCTFGNTFDKAGKSALARDYGLKGEFKHADCDDGAEYTNVVGMYKPNAFGLHDTIGNVAELVIDCEHVNYKNAPIDGSAWTEKCDLFRGEHIMHISRGGAYGLIASPMRVRSANREHFGSGNGEGSSTGEGFRVAMDFEPSLKLTKPASTTAFEIALTQAQFQASQKRSQQKTKSQKTN